ncbi:MAG: prolyl oligopeptidase family serine peptidase [Microbacteriaceae bacterium]
MGTRVAPVATHDDATRPQPERPSLAGDGGYVGAQRFDDLTGAWSSWNPSMTPDAARVAFLSDRSGSAEVWVQDVETDAPLPEPTRIRLPHPALQVSWSADSTWLAVMLAIDGTAMTAVWLVRPDGTDAHLIAGDERMPAALGPWTRSGQRVVVSVVSHGWRGTPRAGETASYLVEPGSGLRRALIDGPLARVLDLSGEERFVIVREGRRGEESAVVVDRVEGRRMRLTHGRGTVWAAFVRPAPPAWGVPSAVYLATDEALERTALVAVPIDGDGRIGRQRLLAERADADLEWIDADDAGTRILLVWNVGGYSELEILRPATGQRDLLEELPGTVVSTPVLSRDGDSVLLAIEAPEHPRELWHVDTVTQRWTRVAAAPAARESIVEPVLETFNGRDGLALSGWLYRVPGRLGPGPAVVSLHGGPEAQFRPGWQPRLQALVRAGYTVFAPNVRGSAGFGHQFAHLDDVAGRPDAFADVVAARDHLVASGIALADRVAVAGERYGGYLALSVLAFEPGVFNAGVDLDGMSDLLNFYRETQPWIAAAAYPKYGHPRHDRALLLRISPLRHAAAIDVPVLIVHDVTEMNVPVGESRRMAAALARHRRPVRLVEYGAGAGHGYLDAMLEIVDFLDEVIGPGSRPVNGA